MGGFAGIGAALLSRLSSRDVSLIYAANGVSIISVGLRPASVGVLVTDVADNSKDRPIFF